VKHGENRILATEASVSREPDAFKQFELSGWEQSSEGYCQGFGPLTAQTVETMLESLKVSKGCRLLDVATGPGYLAAGAQTLGAVTTGIDFSEAMLTLARRTAPGTRFILGDAERLPFPDTCFDAVGMNFGILHLGRPQQAIAEAARVLVPGGWFAFSVWDPPERALGFEVALGAIQRFGSPAVVLPDGPPFFYFSDRQNASQALASVGFASIEITELPLTWNLPDAEALFQAFVQGTARTGGLLRAQPAPNLSAIREAMIAEARARFRNGSGLATPMPAVIYAARKV